MNLRNNEGNGPCRICSKVKIEVAGHLMGTNNNRWTRKITEWQPQISNIIPEIPKPGRRIIPRRFIVQWTNKTNDRMKWRQLVKAYV